MDKFPLDHYIVIEVNKIRGSLIYYNWTFDDGQEAYIYNEDYVAHKYEEVGKMPALLPQNTDSPYVCEVHGCHVWRQSAPFSVYPNILMPNHQIMLRLVYLCLNV